MRKIAEIRAGLSAAVKNAQNVDVKDQKAVDLVKKNLADLVQELKLANAAEIAEQAIAERELSKVTKKSGFSFIKFMREAASGRGLTGVELDVSEIGSDEYRRLGLTKSGLVIPSAFFRTASGQNASTDADGGYAIETQPNRYIEALTNALVMTQLGATFLNGLFGELPIVGSGNFTSSWTAEGAEVSISKMVYTNTRMQPKRLSVIGCITKELLSQTSPDIENLIMRSLVNAHAEALETAAISGTGTDNQPTGILNTAGIGAVTGATNGKALDWKNTVALETTVASANGLKGSLAYLTNAKVMGALKTTEKSTGSAKFLMEDNMVNGYKCAVTQNVPSSLTKGTGTGLSAMIFGNFNDLYIGQWGGIDVEVNPYNKMLSAEILYVLHVFNDIVVARPASFAAIQDVIA